MTKMQKVIKNYSVKHFATLFSSWMPFFCKQSANDKKYKKSIRYLGYWFTDHLAKNGRKMKLFDAISFLTLFLGTSALPLSSPMFEKTFGSDETEKIIGGINATQGQFPYMVSIPVFNYL